MTVSELHGWAKYLAQEPDNSVELQTALVAKVANNAMGGKATLDDMLITRQKPEKTIDDIVAQRPSETEIKFMFGASQ